MGNCIVMHSDDNVATVINKVSRNEKLLILDTQMKVKGEITAQDDIPFAHKIGVTNINKDRNIVKYGEIIGKALMDIQKGGYVHIHNVISIEGSKKVVK